MNQVQRCEGDFQEQELGLNTDSSQKQQLCAKQAKQRIDKFMNPILPKQKAHKVSFKDEVVQGATLHEIKEVENWKAYNIIQESDAVDDCSCIVS